MVNVATLRSLLNKVPDDGRVSAHEEHDATGRLVDAGLLVDCPDGQQYWIRALDTGLDDDQTEYKQALQNTF